MNEHNEATISIELKEEDGEGLRCTVSLEGELSPYMAGVAVAQMQEALQKLQQENQQLKSGAQTKMMEVRANAIGEAQTFKMKQAIAIQDQALARQKLSEEREREAQKMRDEKELAVFKARLEAATKVEVAQIAAKGSLVETALQAENDANIALSQEIKADGDMNVPEPKTPIDRLSDIHQQGMDAHSQSIESLAAILGELTKATTILAAQASKPKTIRAQSSSGATMSATVQ